ncbi:hypothetical protein BH11MYX2_BH11MYX2_37830 [soil metagenome]
MSHALKDLNGYALEATADQKANGEVGGRRKQETARRTARIAVVRPFACGFLS